MARMKIELAMWDWKEDGEAELARARKAVGGRKQFEREVETGSDMHAVVVSSREMSDAEFDAFSKAALGL